MHDTLSQMEARVLDEAHHELSAIVSRYEESAWSLAGPVPSWLHTAYRDALTAALGTVLMLAGHPNAQALCSAPFLDYARGLAELEADRLEAFPRVVESDCALFPPDWEVLDRWTIGGQA